MKRILIYSLGYCVLLTFCSKKRELKDFKGVYVFSLMQMQDSLFIENDSIYRHKFSTLRGEVYEATGTWFYNPKLEEIHFKKFVFFNNDGPLHPPGNWYSKVRFSKNVVDLMYSKENNSFYRKLSPNDTSLLLAPN